MFPYSPLNSDNSSATSTEGDIILPSENVETLDRAHVEETINYVLNKLTNGTALTDDSLCSFKVFYPIFQQLILNYTHEVFLNLAARLPIAYTLIPVLQLCDTNTMLSICAIQHT